MTVIFADDLPIAEVPDNEKLDDEDELSDEEDSNELTDGSAREMPFLAKQPQKSDGRAMKRASTFANFARTSLLPVTAGEEGNLPAGRLILRLSAWSRLSKKRKR